MKVLNSNFLNPCPTFSLDFVEFAKLSAFRACVSFVPTCLRLLRDYVPTCLHAYVHTCPYFLSAYVPSFFTSLRAYVPICIFHAHVPLCLKLFRP